MACEREDRSFMPVAAVARALDPSRSVVAISSIVRTSFSRAPTSVTPSGASRRETALFGRNRSRISSLWISMNPTLIETEVSPGSAATRSNSVRMTRGITPRGSREDVSDAKSRDASRAVPIVNVLPEPVWPYASTVALYPPRSPLTKGSTHCAYSAFSEGPEPWYTWSYVNLCSETSETDGSLACTVTHSRHPSTSSPPTRGRTISATVTGSSFSTRVSMFGEIAP